MTSSVGNVGVKSQLTGAVDRCQLVVPVSQWQMSGIGCEVPASGFPVTNDSQMTSVRWQISSDRHPAAAAVRCQPSDRTSDAYGSSQILGESRQIVLGNRLVYNRPTFMCLCFNFDELEVDRVVTIPWNVR